jgi:hypothetical protein
MFASDKLGRFAIVVVTHLTNLTTCDTKPDVIRLVFTLNTFTVLGIRLNDYTVVAFPKNSANICSILTLEVPTYESLKWSTRNLDVDSLLRNLICSDCKKF